MLVAMWYVYVIRSEAQPQRRYIGMTNDPSSRLAKHNAGGSPYTSGHRPWALDVIVGFSDKARAVAFERYLKTGSGFAFAKKHF